MSAAAAEYMKDTPMYTSYVAVAPDPAAAESLALRARFLSTVLAYSVYLGQAQLLSATPDVVAARRALVEETLTAVLCRG